MKPLYALQVFLFSLCLGLTACGENSDDNRNSTNNNGGEEGSDGGTPGLEDLCAQLPPEQQALLPACGGELPGLDQLCDQLPPEQAALIPACGGTEPPSLEDLCAQIPPEAQVFVPACAADNGDEGFDPQAEFCAQFPTAPGCGEDGPPIEPPVDPQAEFCAEFPTAPGCEPVADAPASLQNKSTSQEDRDNIMNLIEAMIELDNTFNMGMSAALISLASNLEAAKPLSSGYDQLVSLLDNGNNLATLGLLENPLRQLEEPDSADIAAELETLLIALLNANAS